MYFTPETLDFLFENRLHDSRQWFAENKPRFTKFVLTPFVELVGDLQDFMLQIDTKLITQPKVDKTISRIYRDTRFSKDKSLYRDHMWCVFMRDKRLYHGLPGFFFEISPQWYRYGCGYYQADSKSMACLRELILNNHSAFSKAQKAFAGQNLFIMEGDSYKRNHYPEQSPQRQQWLNRTNICFTHTCEDLSGLFSDTLLQQLKDGFILLKPVYNFLLLAEEVKSV